MKGAGWRPAGRDVSEKERIEHGPQDIALCAERVVRGVLLFAGTGVFDHPSQREIGVFGCLREPSGEVIEAGREPRIKLAQAVHAQRNEFVRKKFSERGGDRFKMRMRGNELNVGVDGETSGGQDSFAPYRL